MFNNVDGVSLKNMTRIVNTIVNYKSYVT